MIKLLTEFEGRGEVKGIHFRQVKRVEDLCLYERSDGFFEIIVPRKQKASSAIFKGQRVDFPERETYPKGDSWNGSCVGSLDQAKMVFNRELEKKYGIEVRIKDGY